MRYAIQPRYRIYVKGYEFLSFAKNMGKSLSNKYGQKLIHNANKSATDAIITASKRAIQKSAEATGDLIGNKIANEITSVSKKSNNNDNKNNNNNNNNNNNKDVELTTHKKKIHIPREKKTNY